jgi:hypothetical protein
MPSKILPALCGFWIWQSTVLAASCGTPAPSGERGALLCSEVVTQFTKTMVNGFVSQKEQQNLLTHNTNAECAVQVLRLVYSTIDANNQPATASAAALVPDSQCKGPYPVLLHHHGTSTVASFDAASKDGDLAHDMSVYYASHGYLVVMPNYLGYANSTVTYHPYLQSVVSANTSIDALRAARTAFGKAGLPTSKKLFLSGTSEGGFVTMATQREMELHYAAEFNITASVPATGPYSVPATLLNFMSTPDCPDGLCTTSKSTYGSIVLTGLQQTYHDIYSKTQEVFNEPWASEGIETLIPGQYGETGLFQNCKLPFNLKDAGGKSINGCSSTPLLTQSFVSDYVANQPGTAGQRARNHADAQALLANWKPTAPITLCYGPQDPMAALNVDQASTYFSAVGLKNWQVENIETPYPQNDPRYDAYIAAWVPSAVQRHPAESGYHGQVEAPACTSFARFDVFDRLR